MMREDEDGISTEEAEVGGTAYKKSMLKAGLALKSRF